MKRIQTFLARLFRLPSPNTFERLIIENERLSLDLRDLEEELAGETKRRQELTRYLVELRVSQSDIARAGWAVMCFIPEEVVKKLVQEKSQTPPFLVGQYERIVRLVTEELVRLAVDGVVRVDSEGKVSALVFSPLDTRFAPAAPKYVQALYDSGGKFKLSEKCWDRRTEEQRVKSAAGCGGYGV